MPATRSPVRSVSSIPYHGRPTSRSMHMVAMNISASRCNSSLPTRTVADDIYTAPSVSLPARRRRTPNAFIIYRSYIIANKLYPTELSHQSDVSRYVAGMWRALTPSERSIFFELAEDEKRLIQLESSTDEPRKKRKSRSRKDNTTRSSSLRGELCPASAEGYPVPLSSVPVYSSPLSVPTPSFDPLHSPLHESFAPLTPQPIRAIPPHLLNWGQEMDGTKSRGPGHNELEPTCLPSNPSTSFQIPYSVFFDFLDAEMLNFQLSLDMSTDFMPASPDTPPFGVYLPA